MPAQDIVIQREHPDQPEVVVLLRALDDYLAALYPPEANHIMDVAALCSPEVHFFVAREAKPLQADGQSGPNGRIVGTGAVRLMHGERETNEQAYGEIKRMYVAPAMRGRRIGLALIETLEATLRAEGLTLALLETGRDQTDAVRLYERAGYQTRGAFGGYPDNGLSVFYGKRL